MIRSRPIPALVAAKFTHAIADDSQELRRRIGQARLALADSLDAARIDDTGEARRREALLHALLKVAA